MENQYFFFFIERNIQKNGILQPEKFEFRKDIAAKTFANT